MNPKYPIYIPTKGRADSRLTIKALEYMNVPYTAVVEEQEYDEYAKVVNPKNLLVLDKKYQEEYDTCDDLGDTKSKGPGPARNFIWEHSMKQGHKRHWTMDDNIQKFIRFNNNLQIPVSSGGIFRAMEDFVDRYKNVAMAGPNYYMFVPRKSKVPPFVMNTRIYSCNLILNEAPYRWRGRYNEDTILSLDMLKDGWCTVQFNAFLQLKTTTQKIKGGNTEEFYAKEGTRPKSEMQVKVHPDVSRMVWRFGRIHHYVDYSKFKGNKLLRDKGIQYEKGTNEYGMKLKKKRK